MASNCIPVIRFLPDGDGQTFSPWTPVTHDGVIEGRPEERSLSYFNELRTMPGRVRCGIWESTAYAEKIVNYDKDEFMVVLEGSCTIIDESGHSETFVTGDSFLMPRGFTGIWRQDEAMKKYFMMFDTDIR